jgi:hypothetical protein
MKAPGQSAEDAKHQMWQFVADKMAIAKTGTSEEAVDALGDAIHTLQDWTYRLMRWFKGSEQILPFLYGRCARRLLYFVKLRRRRLVPSVELLARLMLDL